MSGMHVARCAAVVALSGVLLSPVATPNPVAGGADARLVAAQLPARWVHHADVDGDGAADRVVLKPAGDLTIRHGFGTGHVRLRVRLATGRLLRKRLHVDFYYGRRDGGWTPWFGKTQIDHVTGKELVLGLTSGAHTSVYQVVTLRRHRLRLLDSPLDQTGWVVNSSVGTGSQGWLCTRRGVRSRSVVPTARDGRYRIERTSYVLRVAWHETRTVRYSVPAGSNGAPPSYTFGYASFACPGLPSSF